MEATADKIELVDEAILHNEDFKKNVAIPYFKDIFKDLQSRSDDEAKGINKVSLLEYAHLPGVLGERFFSVMDTDNNNYLDQREFFTGLLRIFCSNFDQKTAFVFEIYDFDNDGFNDSIDILPKLASPGDLDADGCLDEDDAFPENGQECVDTDGDGIGNNGDSDDDGDGWTDADEERLGTDSLSASDQPIDSFEIVIPGTAVGLGAWDLIGIFGGVPLFAWIGFGFATRNGRCQRYEELLKEATSRDELEQVALRWEYSLMLRMLGPHQGIRLERLRAELDDKFENATFDANDIGFDQTSIVENEGKDIPPINQSFSGPTKETIATSTDDSGYEWFKQGEENWYRPAGSSDEWFKFEN